MLSQSIILWGVIRYQMCFSIYCIVFQLQHKMDFITFIHIAMSFTIQIHLENYVMWFLLYLTCLIDPKICLKQS